MASMVRTDIWRALFWLGLITVTVLSLLPATYLPSQAFDVWDKAQHAGAYAALAVAGCMGYAGRGVVLLCGLLLHGAVIEFVQYALGWRQGDVLDWFADTVGVMAACALIAVLRRIGAQPG